MSENTPAAALVAGMAAIAALGGEMPEIPKEKGHPPINGNICGHDMGKDPRKKQRRNALCQCNSGLKSKKCCITIVPPAPQEESMAT
jgi:hypothetical protein